jgi:hypothetical protein
MSRSTHKSALQDSEQGPPDSCQLHRGQAFLQALRSQKQTCSAEWAQLDKCRARNESQNLQVGTIRDIVDMSKQEQAALLLSIVPSEPHNREGSEDRTAGVMLTGEATSLAVGTAITEHSLHSCFHFAKAMYCTSPLGWDPKQSSEMIPSKAQK